MFTSKKILCTTLAFGVFISSVTPLSNVFASEKNKNQIQQVSKKNNKNVRFSEDGNVSAQGWKKEVFIYALKYGGKGLEELLEYLGKNSYKKAVKENRLSIAKYLERTENVAKRGLKNFLINECDISPSTSDVIAEAILFFVL